MKQKMDKIAQEWTKQADEIKQTMDNAVAKQQEEIQQTLEKNYEEWKQDSMEFEMKVASEMKRDCAFQIQKSEDPTHVLLEQVKQIKKSSTTAMSKELIEIKEHLKNINMKEDNTEVKNLKAGDTYVPKTLPTDEKQRTLTFRNFPENTKSEYIIAAIKKKLELL